MSLKTVTDQLGNEIKLSYPPQRIISLVPSQTELLYDLGLDKEVVGITKFCEHPAIWHKTKIKVGGTKKLKMEVIDSLRPDLIIGNKEENDKDSIEILQHKYPLWISDIVTLEDALWMINAVGDLTNTFNNSKTLTTQIISSFTQIRHHKARVLYLIWRNPWMGVGSGTFIHSMLELMGLTNVLENQMRYPELMASQIQALNPDHVFLSSEPFPFQEKHVKELRRILPNTQMSLVDGQFFSWYGSRLVKSPGYFNNLGIK